MRSTCSIPNSAGRWQTGSRSVVRGRAGIAVDGHGLTASLGKRVLLIEDDFRLAGMLSEYLGKAGFHVIHAEERDTRARAARTGAGGCRHPLSDAAGHRRPGNLPADPRPVRQSDPPIASAAQQTANLDRALVNLAKGLPLFSSVSDAAICIVLSNVEPPSSK